MLMVAADGGEEDRWIRMPEQVFSRNVFLTLKI